MDLKDFDQQLLGLWQQHHLGHFYIFLDPTWPGDLEKGPPFVFMRQVLKQDRPSTHPDVLVTAPPAKGHYTVEDLEAQGLFNFFDLKSFQGGPRFVVIPQADQLSEVILNKLLKTLENPPPQTTIFFLATHEHFPATILSRANLWRAASRAISPVALGLDLQKALQGFFHGSTPWSVVQEALKAHPAAETALLQWISAALASADFPHYAQAQQLQADWQRTLLAQKWHRPLGPSFYLLLTGIRQYVPSAAQSLL